MENTRIPEYILKVINSIKTLNELHEKEKYNQDIVNDHIELKHTFEIEERVKQEENEVIRQNNFQMRS